MKIRSSILLSLMLMVIGCSSATELVGHWKCERNMADLVKEYGQGKVDPQIVNMIAAVVEETEEYIITGKTVTHIHKSGTGATSSTDPYKVFERDPTFIVLEIGREEGKKLIRFDLVSEDKVMVGGRMFTRVGSE